MFKLHTIGQYTLNFQGQTLHVFVKKDCIAKVNVWNVAEFLESVTIDQLDELLAKYRTEKRMAKRMAKKYPRVCHPALTRC